MLALVLLCVYLSVFSFILGFFPVKWEDRLTLDPLGLGGDAPSKKKKGPFAFIRLIAKVNVPLAKGVLKKRIAKDLGMARLNMTVEEFIFLKELCIVLVLFLSFPMVTPETMYAWAMLGVAFGYMLPEFWLKGKVKRVKAVIIKDLPDAVDLLGLCVNVGLDFMLALKWVVEKSPPSVMIEELNTVLQEINVGKPRRDAIKDLAKRYELPDLSTFARTLIQADKMGTSVTDALNILAEDMRLARYRRGEQIALKAPMKMLVPLLLCIFPVVGIIVAGPIILDFIENSPFQKLGR